LSDPEAGRSKGRKDDEGVKAKEEEEEEEDEEEEVSE